VGQWLYTVVRHLALNVIRKDQRLHPLSQTLSHSWLSGDAQPDAAAENHEFADLAFAALNELPDNQRECVILKFEHGMSYRQIGEVTGLTTSYVGYLIHTGLKALRLRLGAATPARPGAAGGSG
jgi:RNA polymerase sigma-70 factor (ECF subfamily)